jgi:hypothetical protein
MPRSSRNHAGCARTPAQNGVFICNRGADCAGDNRRVSPTSVSHGHREEGSVTKRGIEIKAFHAIWWTLAVLLPDLLGFAMRDWRAAVAGALVSVVMIVLSVRLAAGARWGEVGVDVDRIVCAN